jgi:putative SOS response-associated peptidase YedK
MCGRYTIFMLDTDFEERFGAVPRTPLDARYNAAPNQDLPVIRDDSPAEITHLRWGLIPRWADDRSTDFINARAETLREKRSFAEPFEQRRCLVLADGFYEWAETETGKQPYRVTLEGDNPFCIAGLWERWTPNETQSDLGAFTNGGAEDGNPSSGGGIDGGDDTGARSDESEPDPVETFTIVTTEPNDVVGELHRRMPVVLPRDAERRWLDDDPDDVEDLLTPYEGDMRAYPVSRAVNDPSNDAPELVTEADTEVGAG